MKLKKLLDLIRRLHLIYHVFQVCQPDYWWDWKHLSKIFLMLLLALKDFCKIPYTKLWHWKIRLTQIDYSIHWIYYFAFNHFAFKRVTTINTANYTYVLNFKTRQYNKKCKPVKYNWAELYLFVGSKLLHNYARRTLSIT